MANITTELTTPERIELRGGYVLFQNNPTGDRREWAIADADGNVVFQQDELAAFSDGARFAEMQGEGMGEVDENGWCINSKVYVGQCPKCRQFIPISHPVLTCMEGDQLMSCMACENKSTQSQAQVKPDRPWILLPENAEWPPKRACSAKEAVYWYLDWIKRHTYGTSDARMSGPEWMLTHGDPYEVLEHLIDDMMAMAAKATHPQPSASADEPVGK